MYVAFPSPYASCRGKKDTNERGQAASALERALNAISLQHGSGR